MQISITFFEYTIFVATFLQHILQCIFTTHFCNTFLQYKKTQTIDYQSIKK